MIRPLLAASIAAVLPSCGSVQGSQASDSFRCTVASVTDGDTFRCAEADEEGRAIRVRLAGIAARESDGTCKPGHPCPAASPEASSAELMRLTSGRLLTCRQVGTTYKRRAAFCSRPDGVDLSCAMIASGNAARWDRYWGTHRC